jgi:NAD(P)-dependent dehydrogenase (short-subunit alcohol dehydrogenase family)/acyl carrier protein
MHRFLDTQRSVMLRYLQNRTDGVRADIGTAEYDLPAAHRALSTPNLPKVIEEAPRHAAFTAPASGDSSPAPAASVSQSLEDKPPPTGAGGVQEPYLALNEEELTSRLLRVVSERTGYPPEMLDLDLDLEADLGIDSIKRIEILGNFQQLYASPDNPVSEKEMEKLTTIRTLRGIVEWLARFLRAASPMQPPTEEALAAREIAGPEPADKVKQGRTEESAREGSVRRYTLTLADTPIHSQAGSMDIAGVMVLTDDESGIAEAMIGSLSQRGHEAALVRAGRETTETAPGRYVADFTSPKGIAELLSLIRQRQGPIGGLVHLLPFKTSQSFLEMDLAAWRGRLQVEVKSLFHLAKGLHEDLKNAAQRSGACLLAATGMGGAFVADRPTISEVFPGQGGVAGLMKTLAHEWPEIRVKVVDLNPRDPSAVLATHLFQELFTTSDQNEVGYQGRRRVTLKPTSAPLEPDGHPPALAIDPSWVILITGGARGITAEVGRHLAERYHPTLLLVGRSPLPPSTESPETVGLTSPRELKAKLMARLVDEGRPVALTQVEASYERLIQEREIRSNLAAMARAGARVQYFSADVRDETALGDLIDRIYQTYGKIDGVIHGAGVIEDKLVKDKLPESFDRVFDTKVDGAFILSRKLRPDSLKFLVFFTSVAGRFGNKGQGDYAAANEVLNRLALHLDSRWPARVLSVGWGPWAEVGMVSPELQRQLALRGIELISPAEGCLRMDEELRYGPKGEVEVLLTAGVLADPSRDAAT